MAAQLDDDEGRHDALRQVACSWARTGDAWRARQAAAQVTTPHSLATTLSAVARTLGGDDERGQHVAARGLLEQASQVIDKIPGLHARAEALHELSIAWACAGRADQAWQAATRVGTVAGMAQTTLAVACVLGPPAVAARDTPRLEEIRRRIAGAEAAVGPLPQDAAHVRLLVDVAESFLAVDARGEARRILRGPLEGLVVAGQTDPAMAAIPSVAARLDRALGAAFDLADRLPTDDLRRRAHELLAKTAFRDSGIRDAGPPPDRPERHPSVSDPVKLLWARHYLAQKMVSGAEEIVGQITEPRQRGALLIALTATAIRDGRREPAVAHYREAIRLADGNALRALVAIDRGALLRVLDRAALGSDGARRAAGQ